LHKDTLFGPVLDADDNFTDAYVTRKSITEIDANYLRLPCEESYKEALKRLTGEFKKQGLKGRAAKEMAEQKLIDPIYKPRLVDPSLGKSGIIRDVNLRRVLRKQILKRHKEVATKLPQQITAEQDESKRKKLEEQLKVLGESIDLDTTGDAAKKQFQKQMHIILADGPICMESGIPIHSVRILRTMKDPVMLSRWGADHTTGQHHKVYDGEKRFGDAKAARAYDSQNNHHIEIRVSKNRRGAEIWKGHVVSAFEVAKQLQKRLRKLNKLEKPFRYLRGRLKKSEKKGLTPNEIHSLSRQRQREWKMALKNLKSQRQEIIESHPLVDRTDNDEKGGRFVMSLCEGEMLLMKHKKTGEVGYFVVAKLDKPQGIVVVPHWDARAATERKDSEGKKVPDSKREQFTVKPSDLKTLAPPGYPNAVKVRVTPLGNVSVLECD